MGRFIFQRKLKQEFKKRLILEESVMIKITNLFLVFLFLLKTGLVQAEINGLNYLCKEQKNQELSAFSKPQQIVLGLVDIILKTKEGKSHSDIVKQISFYFDFPSMVRFVLGRTFKTIDAEQRQGFTKLFTEYQVLSFLPKIEKLSLEEEDCFKFLEVTVKEDRIRVPIYVVQTDQENISLFFYIRKINDDVFKIYDLRVEGVSLLLTLREEYRSVISQKGFEGLMNVLKNKLERKKN